MADSNYDALKTKTEKENYDRLLSLFRTGTEIKQWLLDYYISTKCRKELNLLDWLSIQSNNFLQFEDVKRAHRISSTVKSTDLGDNTINTVFMCYCFDIFWDCCLLDTSLEAFLNIHKDELYRNYVNSQKESALPSSPSERYGTSSPENNITKDQWEFLFKNEENEKSISASNGIAVSCLDRYQNLFILNIVCALFKSVKVVSECQIQISKIAALQCKSTKIEFDEMWDKLEAHILTIGEKCSFNCFFQRKCTEIKQTVFNRSLVQENRKYILQEALNNPTFIRDRDFCNSVRKELDMITVEENLNLARKLCGRDISVTLIDGEYRAGSYSSSVIENAGNDLQKLTSLNSYKDTYLYQRETEGEIQRDDMQEGINKHYYLKLVQLITNIGKNVLVDVLKGRLPGTNFGYAFNGMKNRILPLLNCQACQVLFPDNSYYKGDLSDLDISLMYLILRNLNTICPHKTGWGNMPEDDDRDMSANIERIRIFKNSYVSHHPKCSVNVEDFQKTWTEIRACIIELGGSEYTRRIDCLFTSEINPVIERELFNTLAQAKEAKRHDEINMLHLKAILDEIKLQLHEITRNRGTSTESSGMVSLELKLEGENIPLIREIEKLLNKLSPKYVLIKSLQEGSIIMCLDISSSAFHSLGYFLEVIESLLCIVLQRQLLSDDGITTHLIISLDFMDKNNEPLVYRQPSFDMVEGMKKWYEEEDKTGNNIKLDVQLPTEPIPSSNIKVKSSLAERKPNMNEQLPMGKLHEFVKDQVHGLNSDDIDQPQNLNEWMTLSKQLRKKSLLKLESGKIQRGRRGHDVTLVLDCSGRMQGKSFTTMIEAATKYVNGIKQVKMVTSLEDNIGLAVFGGTSGLIVESTSNYDLVLKEISQLRPGGEAPLFGGLLMGLSGVLGSATSQILENEVPGFIIVFTDKMAGNTSIDKKNEIGIDPLYFIGNAHEQDDMGSVISMIESHSIKIFYVPTGENIRNEVMEMAVCKTKGKVIPLNELHRLVKMTQELILAARVASDLRHTNPHPTADDVRLSISQRSSNPNDAHDDCVDLVLEFVDTLSVDKNKGLYNELECRSLQLGDRVRRGPKWRHDKQDSGLAGTVVGQIQNEEVWVEWDSGHLNKYIYDEKVEFYSIKKVNEPRVLVDELVAVGCKVTRGNDWKYNDDDGGPGSIGTVLCVKDNGSVVVRWDCKKIGVYKMKTNDSFEIQICTDSPTYKQTAKVNLSTNKQKSAEFVIGNLDASTQKNTITSITKNSDQQEEEHNVKSVSHANTDSDSGNFSQPQNIREWLELSERLRKQSLLKRISGKIQRGRHGHDVTLVLDCSERMRGQAFTTMIESAKKYVNGIKQVKMATGLEDNIGLAVFGGKSGLIIESTSNYDLVLEEICKLRPGGEAPLFGGFLMGLSGVLGIGATSQIMDNEVQGYMIVFTDGMAGKTSTDKKNTFGIDPSYLIGNVHRHDEIGRVISLIASHLIKIFYVPIGDNVRNEVMEMAVIKTKGKVIPLNELHRLVKMTQELILAAQVASDLRRTNPNPTADDVRSSILQRTSNPGDAHDDCVDLVLEFVYPLSADKSKGLYNELECRSLQLGDRVRRGPNWMHEEQDSGCVGTVVGQDQDKEVWVEWDSGHLNIYIYNEDIKFYSIKKVQEPRVLVDELVAVGCKVTRGSDWKYDNDDGGPGSIGTVLGVKDNGSVVVRWDCRKIGVYKMGKNGLFEIQICNDSSTYKPSDSADVATNKQKGAGFANANQLKKTAKSDKQKQEHIAENVPHANTENELFEFLSNTLGLDGSEHTNITEMIEAEKTNFYDPELSTKPRSLKEWMLNAELRKNELLKLLSNTLGLDGSEHTNISDLIDSEKLNFCDQDPSRQPRSTIEWLSYAEQLRENAMTRLQSGSVKRGRRGHDVALVLDCSERMKGEKFDTMIETAKIYVNGIKQIKRVRMLEDNIGLAVFGGTSKVVVQTTSDYDLVLKEIGQLKPEGEAPLVGGLLMGLACALGGGTSEILGNEVPGYMVVFTDGMSANIKPELDQDINPAFLIGDFKKHDRISSIIKKIAGFAVKIFYVPIGVNEQNEVMQCAVSETNGKVICRQEIHRLVRMTQVLMLAAEVASDLRKNNSNPTAAEVREKIVQQTSRPDDAHNDCVDLVLEFVKPRIKERKKGLYSELVCRTLLLGDRVRRGPDWSFHEQDSGLAGTVVGQDSDSEAVWVEWDNGHLNMYIYDERLDIYSIKKVQEPRVLVDELVAVGCKVTRGKDWTYADADGGPGSVGTVLCVNQDGSVLVRWGSSNTDEYKMGMNGLFEIQICDDSSTRKPTYKADANTNKYQSADSSKSDVTAGQEKKEARSSDKNIQLPWLVDGGEFQCMLSKGEYLSYENRLSLGGPCRAGKSTLASMLIGDEIPLEWNSTDALVIYFGRNGIDIENRKMFPLQEGELGHEVFAKILRGDPNIGNESDQIIRQGTQTSVRRVRTEAHTVLTFESTTSFTQDDNETTNYATDQFATETKVSISQSDMENHSTEALYSRMPPATTDVQTLDCQKLQLQSDLLAEVRNGQFRIKIAPSDIIDFGGQKAYDMTHQLFIQHRGSFLLMFDGRLGLHNQLVDYPEGITAAIILTHWVDSVLTYTEDTDDIMPMILFAATHKDQCEGDIEMMRAYFIRDIEAMFSNHEKRDHIHLDTVYFINGIDKHDPEIQHLTDRIVLFAMQQSTWGQRRPMQWVPLELQISKMRMDNINIITLEEIQSINKLNADLTLREDQLNDFLLVQHSLGKLMYYNLPGLDKCIIIHPPVLVDILKSFVTDEKFFPADTNLKSILQTLTQTGKISQTDLFQLWQQDHLHQYMKDDSIKEFVLQLLVHLDILIVPKTFKESSANEYLVPCMIKTILPDFKNLQHLQERTICLAYSLNKTSIPSALAYKVIGAAITNWPLKEESEKPNNPCLYHQAAVLNVSEDDELRIWLEENRVMVTLTNKNSLFSISPDVAASIQECLTMIIESSLLFYFNSFGKKIKSTEVFELYTLALGFPCGNRVCFKSAKHVDEVNCWTCDRGKKHETKYLKYWIFDKSQTMCAEGCKGLSDDELRTEPSNKHLVRLVSQIDIESFREFYINLGMTKMQWDKNSDMYGSQSCEGRMSMALVKWKKSKLSDGKDHSLKDLSDALEKVNLEKHVICQVFREETELRDDDDLNLQKIPIDGVLKGLSYKVGNCAPQLGIELGVSVNDIENSLFKFPKDLPGLIEDILMKWKAKSKIKTFKRLLLALQRVNGGGGEYLRSMLKKP